MELPNLEDNLHIRLATFDDLPALLSLEWSGRALGTIADRLMYQHAGYMEFLLAVVPAGIAGYLLLKWHGPEDPVLKAKLPACAEIEDFVVGEAYRRRGIGGRMLDEAAMRTARRGMQRLGLVVMVENSGAMALYERHGFRGIDDSFHTVTWLTVDAGGGSHLEQSTCLYMMKDVQ